MKKGMQGIAEKAMWSLVHAAEKKLFSENFIISNLTIDNDNLMTQR